jgi:hypothetical protein
MILKIDNFCSIEECDQIIGALKEIAGDMHDMYHIGKSHGHNPLKHETVYQILKPKLNLLFGSGRFYSAWGNIIKPDLYIMEHNHDEHAPRYGKPFTCTNLFLGGDTKTGTRFGDELHENKHGQLQIFPSALKHDVPHNKSGDFRYSLVIDVMPIRYDVDWIKI